MTTTVDSHWRDVPEGTWGWPNFSPAETACQGTGKLLVNEAALDKLQALRDPLGKPLIVHSAYLVLATIWLSGCATVGSEGSGPWACPLVVEYCREFQARAAEEPDLLPEGSAIAEMMSDYAVLREQARVC